MAIDIGRHPAFVLSQSHPHWCSATCPHILPVVEIQESNPEGIDAGALLMLTDLPPGLCDSRSVTGSAELGPQSKNDPERVRS